MSIYVLVNISNNNTTDTAQTIHPLNGSQMFYLY